VCWVADDAASRFLRRSWSGLVSCYGGSANGFREISGACLTRGRASGGKASATPPALSGRKCYPVGCLARVNKHHDPASRGLEWVSMMGSNEVARSRSSRWVSRLQGSGGDRADSLQWASRKEVCCQGELMGWMKQEQAGPTQSPQ
jgi:hypothetical protein